MTTTKTTAAPVIDIANVVSVYSGVAGMCCCGCSGKHTYSTTHRQYADKERGYPHPITDDEVNDGVVKRIINKMNNAAKLGTTVEAIAPGCLTMTVGKRLYIAYLKAATP